MGSASSNRYGPRGYTRHRLAAVRWLAANYSDHSLRECAAQLGLTTRQVFGLCRRNGIRKRAPNRRPPAGP